MNPSSRRLRTPSSFFDSAHDSLSTYALVARFIAVVGFLTLAAPLFAANQEKILYSFNGNDGAFPNHGLIRDAAGNLYGTTTGGGVSASECNNANDLGCGTVFELTPTGVNGTWTETVLHRFTGTPDGSQPGASLIFDGHGNLYGTTGAGGASGYLCTGYGCGAVFRLRRAADGSWTEELLHSFNGNDGSAPAANLIFDADGNLYGTTSDGGLYDSGTVFELTPKEWGGWKETVLHNFNKDGKDGAYPEAGLIFDAAGNLYGTTYSGGAHGFGTAFQLKRCEKNRWKEHVLHSFDASPEGYGPYAALTFDKAGNLFGTTSGGGRSGSGTVFRLKPSANSKWAEEIVYNFCSADYCADGGNPHDALISDTAGNLYGTASTGGNTDFSQGEGYGTVFELTPGPNGRWTETVLVLHAFNHDGEDGTNPSAGLVRDPAGHLYGTTGFGGISGSGCGGYGCGAVFEITR